MHRPPSTGMKVARQEQLSRDSGLVVMAACDAVALFQVDGLVVGLSNWCLRCGSSLGSGAVRNSQVACPGCDWRYDLATGAVVGIPALRVDMFDVRVIDGDRAPLAG